MSLSVSHIPPAVPASGLRLGISNFSNTLQCPVMITPLADAVMLIPCGHTISEIAANNIYREMRIVNGRETAGNQAPCVICRAQVTAYHPNHAIRSLVGMLLEGLPLASAQLSADEEKNLDAIPFPGLGAKFVLTEGDWNINDSGSYLVRSLCFTSHTEGSLFQAMNVLGYRDGSVHISISFRENNRKAGMDYLSACGIDLDYYTRNVSKYYKSELIHNKLLFRILAKHNDIPADKFLLIRDLVARGNWNNVTPLAANESLSTTGSQDRLYGFLM